MLSTHTLNGAVFSEHLSSPHSILTITMEVSGRTAAAKPRKTSAPITWGREKGLLKARITQLEKTILRIRLENRRISSLLKERDAQLNDLQCQIDSHLETINTKDKEIQDLSSRLNNMTSFSIHEKDKTILNHRLSHDLMCELQALATQHPKHRRYSQEMLEVAFLIRSLSAKTYRQLRAILPLPCKETIRLYFYDAIQRTLQQTLEIQSVGEKLMEYRASIGTSETITCTVGMDAAAIEIFHLMKVNGANNLRHTERLKLEHKFKKMFQTAVESMNVSEGTEYRNFFAFLILPLKHEFPIILAHVSPSRDGHLRDEEMRILHELREGAADAGMIVQFAATDGETGTNQMHRDQADTWLDGASTASCGALAQKVGADGKIWFVSDVFHLLKGARARIVNHPVAVNPENSAEVITSSELEGRLHLGKTLTDRSSQGKMNDWYPIDLFRCENALKEFESKNYQSGLYILAWALLFQCFCNKDFGTRERLTLIEFTFWIFLRLLIKLYGRFAVKVSEVWRTGLDAVTFASKQTMFRVMNTLLALYQQVEQIGDGFSTKRLSSHDCENLFGLYRATNGFHSTWDTVHHFIGHLALQSAIRNRLLLGYLSASRCDYAGCVTKSDESDMGGKLLARLGEFGTWLVGICLMDRYTSIGGQMPESRKWFEATLMDMGIPTPRRWQASTKGSAIVSRLQGPR